MHERYREVMVDGVVRCLSDNVIVAPPIPQEFGHRVGSEYRFGRKIQDFFKGGDFIPGYNNLWRHWSYPPMLGPFAFGKGQLIAEVTAPIRGLYLGRTEGGLGNIHAFTSREDVVRACGFIIVMFEGDTLHPSNLDIYDHLIHAVEGFQDSFQHKKVRGERHPSFDAALKKFKSADPWIGNVKECPFTKIFGGIEHFVREGILKAHTVTMRT